MSVLFKIYRKRSAFTIWEPDIHLLAASSLGSPSVQPPRLMPPKFLTGSVSQVGPDRTARVKSVPMMPNAIFRSSRRFEDRQDESNQIQPPKSQPPPRALLEVFLTVIVAWACHAGPLCPPRLSSVPSVSRGRMKNLRGGGSVIAAAVRPLINSS